MTITRVQLVGNVSTGASFSGIVTATSFSGNVTGNATGLSGTPNITVGNVTGSAATFTNLTVNGTQTIINTTSLEIADKTVGIASTSSPTDANANGAGIVVYGTTNKSLTWNNTSKNWGLVGGGLTVASGPFIVGSATSTGTASQTLQVTGGGYISGSLAIGVTSPGNRLDLLVSPASGGADGLKVSDGTRNCFLQITGSAYSYNGAGASETLLYGSGNPLTLLADGQPIKFCTGSSEKARLDTSGRLLVGTSSGQGNSLLQIKGDSAGSTGVGAIFLQRGLSIATISSSGTVDLAKIEFGNQDGAIGAVIQANADATWGTNDYPSRLTFSTTADGASSPTERMRVTSTGNVGIATANPTSRLHVVGDALISGVVTATSYRGDGSQLTGVSAGIQTEALIASGIVTTLNLTKQDHKVTATGITTITVSGGTEGDSHTVRIVNSGIATVGFSTYFLFPSGSPPVLPTASGAISLISFTVHRVGTAGTQLLAGASLNFS